LAPFDSVNSGTVAHPPFNPRLTTPEGIERALGKEPEPQQRERFVLLHDEDLAAVR
jgi:hypothetical protein